MVYIGHPKPFQILGRMRSGSDRTHCAPPCLVYDAELHMPRDVMHYADPLAGPHSIIGSRIAVSESPIVCASAQS